MRKRIESFRKALLEPEKTYYPNEEESLAWFNLLNRVIFDKSLDRCDIRIKRLKKIWGQCIITPNGEFSLEFTSLFPSKRKFFEVLGHEMVHLYQLTHSPWMQEYPYNQRPITSAVFHMIEAKVMTHGPGFFEWRPRFEKYHLALNERY